jgi:hypothetical protein
MANRERSDIDISHISTSGLAGLGLVVMVAVVAYTLPALRWLAVACLAGGVIGGLAVFAYRRRKADPGSAAKGPTLVGHLKG